MNFNEGAIIFEDNFKILAGILSRPVALHAFRPLKVEATLSRLISTQENYLWIGTDKKIFLCLVS
jgi:ligand-binding sensor domain-containing protein